MSTYIWREAKWCGKSMNDLFSWGTLANNEGRACNQSHPITAGERGTRKKCNILCLVTG